MQKNIDEILKEDFKPEVRFMSHITIARPKFIKDRKEFIDRLKKIRFEKKKFNVDKIFLRKSELARKGAKYFDLLVVEKIKKI